MKSGQILKKNGPSKNKFVYTFRTHNILALPCDKSKH